MPNRVPSLLGGCFGSSLVGKNACVTGEYLRPSQIRSWMRSPGPRVMVLFPKSLHAGNSLPPAFPLFLGKRGRCAGSRLQSPFDDLLGRAAHTARERRFKQSLPVRRELDRHHRCRVLCLPELHFHLTQPSLSW